MIAVRALTPVLLLLTTLAACDRSAPRDPTPGPADDVAIFAALLADECAHPGKTSSIQLVLDVPAPSLDLPLESWNWKPPDGYVETWARRSSEPVRWPKRASCAIRLVVEKETVDALIEKDQKIPPSYQYFHEAFPDARGIVAISLPAYSADGQAASVLVRFRHQIMSDLFSGGADVVSFTRSASGWRPAQVHNVWFSVN